MGSAQKLKLKLERGNITARELRTLLRQEGWSLDRARSSHEFWIRGARTFVLATHDKDLKIYQIKQAQSLLLERKEKNQ